MECRHVQTLMKQPGDWLGADGPESTVVFASSCTLMRNLSDFPFPDRCGNEERAAVEDRVQAVLCGDPAFADGTYYSLLDLSETELRFLVDSWLLSPETVETAGPRGCFVSADKSLSVTINGENHLELKALGAGLQLKEVWQRLDDLERRLTERLDFAYDERLGYLTTSLSDVGTGLRASAVMHLAGLAIAHGGSPWSREGQGKFEHFPMQGRRYTITPVFGEGGEAHSDLYEMSNRATLGRSEEEILFHLNQKVQESLEKERMARRTLCDEAFCYVEDRVCRAYAVASAAHLMGEAEAVSLLSAIRLGVELGASDDSLTEVLGGPVSLAQLNELLVDCQTSHILLKECAETPEEGDGDVQSNMARAALLRRVFRSD